MKEIKILEIRDIFLHNKLKAYETVIFYNSRLYRINTADISGEPGVGDNVWETMIFKAIEKDGKYYSDINSRCLYGSRCEGRSTAKLMHFTALANFKALLASYDGRIEYFEWEEN